MTCGRTRRAQFASQSEYEQHRTALLKMILGPNWQDLPLPELIARHPELHHLSLAELIAKHEHIGEGGGLFVRQAEATEPEQQQPTPQDKPGSAPRAIEDSAGRQTAEEWLKNYIREHDGADRED